MCIDFFDRSTAAASVLCLAGKTSSVVLNRIWVSFFAQKVQISKNIHLIDLQLCFSSRVSSKLHLVALELAAAIRGNIEVMETV